MSEQRTGRLASVERAIDHAWGVGHHEGATYEGTWGGHFVTMLICALLSIFIIPIPWMVIKYFRWVLQNISLDGRRLIFTATGGRLLIRCIIWFFWALIPIYGLLTLPKKIAQFVVSHLHFEDQPDGQSEFHGSSIAMWLLAIVFFAAPPAMISYLLSHSTIDGVQFVNKASIFAWIAKFIFWGLMNLITLGFFAFLGAELNAVWRFLAEYTVVQR